MRRDGIGVSAHPGMGEKAGWVTDMLAAVDPRVWARQFERSPRECVALAEHSEFRAVLIRGWALATLRGTEADAPADLQAWLQELALWWIGADIVRREAVPDALLGMIAARFHENAGGASLALLDAFPDDWFQDGELVQLLHRLADRSQETWTPALTSSFLQRLQAIRPTLLKQGQPGLARLLLPAFARVADAATVGAVEAEWRAGIKADSEWRATIDQFFELVRLRHEMILSFQEPA
jgi:hypothetical protein